MAELSTFENNSRTSLPRLIENCVAALRRLPFSRSPDKRLSAPIPAAALAKKKILRRDIDEIQQRTTELGEAVRELTANLGIARLIAQKATDRALLLESLFVEATISAGRKSGEHAAGSGLLVSIILPTFNRAHCISDAIGSVLTQTHLNWELIIVDDGSTDATDKVLARYLTDLRVNYIKQDRDGPAAARNRALRVAKGEIVTYIDSDNIWFPNFLSAVVRSFSENASQNLVYGALLSKHHGEGMRVLLEPYDRQKLLEKNYIDLNTFAHRRDVVERVGNFDERLTRLTDWDLILRYSADSPPEPLPVLAAEYRIRDSIRVSDTASFGPNYFGVRRKWIAARRRSIKVLYVVWHYPQLSESYIETEVQCMRRFGVEVEVWRESMPVSPYPSNVRVHDGPLAQVIEAVQPDILHVHWLGFALAQESHLQSLGIPVTVRLHGFEVNAGTLRELLKRPWVSRIYAFPHQLNFAGVSDPRLRSVRSSFDTTLFAPEPTKDRNLVIRTAAALEGKDLLLFFDVAERLPNLHFVLAAVTCNDREEYAAWLRDEHRRRSSKVELLFDVPRPQIAGLLQSAGTYLQTARRPGQTGATPIGMPVGIAEAMATGAHILAPAMPEFASYLNGVGTLYTEADDAANKIDAMSAWTEEEWRKSWTDTVDQAFIHHADELVLSEILRDWQELTFLTQATRIQRVTSDE